MSKQRLNGCGWLAGTRFVVLLTIGILWALPATARDRPVFLVGLVEPPQVDPETGLFVGDVERLHDVFDKLWNDPAALGLPPRQPRSSLRKMRSIALIPPSRRRGA